jgi:hypothetical protein
MSNHRLAGGAAAADDTLDTCFAAFDYNFCGGEYRGYRRLAWMFKDGHNQLSTDTMNGDLTHQVWPLGSEPDWFVPNTSTAYHSGLDLSDSFRLRDSTYGPLPGMTRGYFTGVAPNLGAVQDTACTGMPQGDSGHGSIMRPLELAFAPNPATGSDVTVRCAVPAERGGKITLRDVLGRAAKSFVLDPSGLTRLDLRGFAPGIYIAELGAAGPPVTGKLIVASR